LDETSLNEILVQGDVIIGLLGRVVFPPDILRDIITKGKKKPDEYLKGYNACDGTRGVTDLAKIVGVSIGTLSPILQNWKDQGIVYEINKPRGTFYKNLYLLK